MLQRLPITLAQVKARNNSDMKMKSDKLFILCINQKKPLKNMQEHNYINANIKYGYYIYKL